MRRLLLLGLAAAGLAFVLKRRTAGGTPDVQPFAPPAPTAPVPPAPRPEEPVEQQTAAQEEQAQEPAIKGNRAGKYHTPDSPYYKRTKAERWFTTREEAEAAGYVAWDAKRQR